MGVFIGGIDTAAFFSAEYASVSTLRPFLIQTFFSLTEKQLFILILGPVLALFSFPWSGIN